MARKWLLHEANEVYNYASCVESEENTKIRAIWERFLEYELGQLRFVADLFENVARRDASEVLTSKLPDLIDYTSHREFVRQTLRQEIDLRALGPDFVGPDLESQATLEQRQQLNSEGSPSEAIAAGYVWHPGTELARNPPTSAHNASH